jgi:hypothetical protein
MLTHSEMDSAARSDDIRATATATPADYKVPERFEIASEIPGTACGSSTGSYCDDDGDCQSRGNRRAAATAAA